MEKNAAGYSLLELTIVLVMAAILVSAVTVNFAPAVISLDVENVASQVAATLSRIHREALKGNTNSASREFKLESALAARHPGIILSENAPDADIECNGLCA